MKYLIFIIFIIIGCLLNLETIAQVGDIKRDSQRSNSPQNNSPSNSPSNSPNTSGNGNIDVGTAVDVATAAAEVAAVLATPENCNALGECAEGCGNSIGGCFTGAIALMEGALIGLEKGHTYILNRQPIQPFVKSFEFTPSLFYHPAKYYGIYVAGRYNSGIFGVGFRHNRLYDLNGRDQFISNEGNFSFNLVHTKAVLFSLGSGFYSEYNTESPIFIDFIGVLHIRWKNNRWKLNTEFRSSQNFVNGANPRSEVFSTINYQFAKAKHTCLYGSGGGFFQQFYGNTKVYGIVVGLQWYIY